MRTSFSSFTLGGTCFRPSQISLLALAFLSFFVSNISAQTGNDNVSGPAGIFNGNVTTAGNYDPYTTNVRRDVVDISVAGAVGTQPLVLVRTYNSRNPNTNPATFGWGGWRHNYEWDASAGTSQVQHFQPTSYTVAFPDGRSETFPQAAQSPWPASSKGVVERFIPMNPPTNMKSYLLLNDGSKVEFTATETDSGPIECREPPAPPCIFYHYDFLATAIYDPYGLKTTLTYNQYGLRVTEPTGQRALQFVNATISGSASVSGATVIDHVNTTDGRRVQYRYVGTPVAGATHGYTRLDSVTYYQDTAGAPFGGETPVTATYTYIKPNAGQAADGVPLLRTCVDPMYAGPMWMIAYGYATANNPDGSIPVYGQILGEYYYNGTGIGGALSKLEVTSTTKRKETRGDGPNGIGPIRTFTYTGNLLTSCTDFNNKTASQGHDGNNFVNSVTDRNNNKTTYTRNPIIGNVTQITFPATPSDAPAGQGKVTYTYGSASCPDQYNKDPNNPYYVCTMTDEGGQTTTYYRDTNHRVRKVVYPDGEQESINYNGFGQIMEHYPTSGSVETYTYDARGLKTEYRDPYHDPFNKGAKANLRYKYNTLDRVTDITDALGASLGDPAHTTSFTYNARGQVLYLTHPTDPNDGARHFIRNIYNPNGNGTLTSVTDELSHTTAYVYDAYKRLSQVTTPQRGNGDNSTNTTSLNYTRPNTGSPYYHTANFPFSVTSPAGTVVNSDCDANFRKTSVTQAPGRADQAVTTFTYDAVGNVMDVKDPLFHITTTDYDERNRPMSVKDPLNNTTSFRYDAAGRKAAVTRPSPTPGVAGQVITYDSYDAMNRLLQQTVRQSPNPAAVTKYTYDPSGGQLQTMTDPNGNVYAYGYDFLNRKTSLKYPDNSTETWTYNSTGNGTLNQFKNRSGNIETFSYDNLNRVTLSNWNDSATPDVTTAYDAANRVTSITNANSTITRSYFNDNLLNTETNKYGDNIARTVSYSYDADGRRAAITYPNSAYSFTYAYTGRGQLDYVKDTANIINFNYFRDGTVYQRALDNATNSFYGYDAMARVTSITHNLTGTTRTFGYGYDAVGNRKWVQRDGGNGDVYGYDLNDQSTAVKLDIANPDTTPPGPQTIVYDASGSRKSFSPYGSTDTYAAANALNQYTTRNGNPAVYDLNGNMTTGLDGSTYTYDAQNRLLSAKKGATTDTFLYDGLNRQIGKKIGSQALYYRVYDGWDLLGEYKTGTSNAFWAYLYANGGVVKNLVTNNYYYQDASGSTSHVANSAGALKEYYRYDLHGQPFFYDASGNQMSDTAIGVRHLFTGQQWYNEIGLYDLRNRYYSPDIGRFLQSDPISFGGDAVNLYRYCGNNPVNYADPSGQSLISIFQSIGLGINNFFSALASRVTVVGSPVPGASDVNHGLTSTGGGEWQPRNPNDPAISGGTFPGGNPFSNPIGLGIRTGVGLDFARSLLPPAFNPTIPYTPPSSVNSDRIRRPDFYQGSFAVPLGPTPPWVFLGATANISLNPANGHIHFGAGPSAGFPNAGWSVTGNWVGQWTGPAPTAGAVDGAIMGASVNPGGAYGGIAGGASFSLTGGPTTFGIGVGSKGIGVSATGTIQLYPFQISSPDGD